MLGKTEEMSIWLEGLRKSIADNRGRLNAQLTQTHVERSAMMTFDRKNRGSNVTVGERTLARLLGA